MDDNILKEIIEEIENNINELGNSTEDFLQKIAYVETLEIIKSAMTGYDLAQYGLDEDLDAKYKLIKNWLGKLAPNKENK